MLDLPENGSSRSRICVRNPCHSTSANTPYWLITSAATARPTASSSSSETEDCAVTGADSARMHKHAVSPRMTTEDPRPGPIAWASLPGAVALLSLCPRQRTVDHPEMHQGDARLRVHDQPATAGDRTGPGLVDVIFLLREDRFEAAVDGGQHGLSAGHRFVPGNLRDAQQRLLAVG